MYTDLIKENDFKKKGLEIDNHKSERVIHFFDPSRITTSQIKSLTNNFIEELKDNEKLISNNEDLKESIIRIPAMSRQLIDNKKKLSNDIWIFEAGVFLRQLSFYFNLLVEEKWR